MVVGSGVGSVEGWPGVGSGVVVVGSGVGSGLGVGLGVGWSFNHANSCSLFAPEIATPVAGCGFMLRACFLSWLTVILLYIFPLD